FIALVNAVVAFEVLVADDPVGSVPGRGLRDHDLRAVHRGFPPGHETRPEFLRRGGVAVALRIALDLGFHQGLAEGFRRSLDGLCEVQAVATFRNRSGWARMRRR